jgi:OOP family OmpA-OmpF porin
MENQMKINKIHVLAVSLALASPAAFAQNKFLQSSYIGLSAGQTTTKLDSADFAAGGATVSDDKTDSAYKLYAGYRFSPVWGVEGGYADLGKASRQFTSPGLVERATVDNSAWFLAAKATFAVTPTIGLFGKLGVSRNQTESSFSSPLPGESGTSKHTRNGTIAGLGAEWAWTRNVGVRFEYEDFGKFGNQSTGRSKVHLWTVGLTYAF